MDIERDIKIRPSSRGQWSIEWYGDELLFIDSYTGEEVKILKFTKDTFNQISLFAKGEHDIYDSRGNNVRHI
jgi:hypothetical protein